METAFPIILVFIFLAVAIRLLAGGMDGELYFTEDRIVRYAAISGSQKP